MTTTDRSAERAAPPSSGILAMLLMLGAVATLMGWAALALGGADGSIGSEPGGESAWLAPSPGPLPMEPIPDVVTVDTALPLARRPADVVSTASRR